MNTSSKGTALITGASSGIGAIYADRFALRGHDLILVARNRERLDALAKRLTEGTGRSVHVIVADLNDRADLDRVEHWLGDGFAGHPRSLASVFAFTVMLSPARAKNAELRAAASRLLPPTRWMRILSPSNGRQSQ